MKILDVAQIIKELYILKAVAQPLNHSTTGILGWQ